jgi:OOP family OmpA-OmpF porin
MMAALALMSSPALAQDHKGFYIGLGAGLSEFKDACAGIPAGASCDEEDTATKFFGGYQFNRNFAVEAGYTDLGKGSASQAGVGSASLEASGFEILAVGIAPLNPKWSLYGKAGLFIWDVDLKLSPGLGTSENESGTDLTFAFGVGWDITKNFGVRFEYQVYSNLGDENTTGEGDVNVLGANAIFRF